jgi:N-acyl-D-amino-acid deacylase
MSKYFASINGEYDHSEPISVEDFLAEIDRSAYLNVAFLVPHGNVRMDVMGIVNRAPDASELRAMMVAVERALESGAIGISTGLDYIPSKYASADEFNALASLVRAAGGVFVSHMRGYGERLPGGLSELAAVAAASQVKIHASHLWGTTDEVAEGLASCEAVTVELSFDAYPYRRGSSLLTMAAVPSRMQEGGLDRTMSRLRSPDCARQLEYGLDPALPGRLTLSYIAAVDDQGLIGVTVEEAAARRGQSAAELICDLLLRSNLNVGVVMARANFTDDDRDYISKHPLHMGSSDGIFVGGRPHPRAWAAFTKLVELYVNDDPVDGWSTVAAHLSARAADRFGLKDRGHLRPGYIADIAVLNPDELRANATYVDPRQLSSGARHVLVNGSAVIRDGIFTPSADGVAIRMG